MNEVNNDVTVCPNCLAENKGNALNCRCGTALNNECLHCGTRNLVSARSCSGCNSKLL